MRISNFGIRILQLAKFHALWVGCLLIGCGPASEEQAGTGAKECAENYFQAVLDHDWTKAYTTLDESGRKRWTTATFAELGKKYRRELGFEPREIHVRACEEHGDEATAHVVLVGPATAKEGRSKEAVLLRRNEGRWQVVLSPTFGRAAKR